MSRKTRGKKRQQIPKWIWQLPPDILMFREKRLLAYIWWCGERGCRDWNYSIANRFGKSRRTIKRWLKHLDDLHLVYINYRHTKHRIICRRPYFSKAVWLLYR